MKRFLPPSTRATAIGLALTLSVFTTLVAIAPAGASPVSDGASLLAYKGVVVQPSPDGTVTPDGTTPNGTAPAAAPTQDPSQPVDAGPTPTATPPASPIAAPTPVAVPVIPTAPRPIAKPAPRPARVPHPVTKPTRKPAPTHPSGSALSRAIAAIPGYSAARPVTWVMSSSFGHYGMTDWYHNTIYLSPTIPASQLASVAKHEYGHILEARAYGGDIPRMIAGISRIFGAGGRGNLNGTELAADCIAVVNGASWTHYTGCNNATWRAAARQLIAGHAI
ncbi:MAG: hypothetical protein QOG52_506 [Frankiaceae bacterium]|nr:hypothetical protein [Frankiaceae bacterium]